MAATDTDRPTNFLSATVVTLITASIKTVDRSEFVVEAQLAANLRAAERKGATFDPHITPTVLSY